MSHMTDSSPESAPAIDSDAELRELMRFATEELGARAGEAGASGELDDRALGRRNESMLRHRRSDESMEEEEVGERFAPVGAALDPPARFVRKPRIVLPKPPACEAEERETERRSLIVSSVYPSFRAVAPQARTVRWGRKRKPEVTWDDVARPAHQAARLERAKAFAGSVAYI